MSTLCILFHLNRSNPMIFRAAALPDHFPLAEVGELCCLTFGLKSADCYYEILSADEYMESDTISENRELTNGMTGTVRLAKDAQTQKLFALDVSWSVSEENINNQSSKNDPGNTDKIDHTDISDNIGHTDISDNMDHSGNASAISFPVLKGWLGYQLPAGVFSVSIINEIGAAFQHQSSYQLSTGETLYREPLRFICQKTNNAICMRYAPDLARPEIKMELGIPLIDLVETMTLADIKEHLDHMHKYGYATEKKASCVTALAVYLSHEGQDQLFGQMEMKEYLNFRKFVLSGTCDCHDNDDLSKAFPALWEACRIRFVKKTGVRIAADILQAYSQWFDSPEEMVFRKNKKIRQAMRWCGFYYGIFSLDHCWQVLQTVYPGEIRKEDLTAYWEEVPDFADAENISFADTSYRKHSPEVYAYDPRVISAQNLNYYLSAVKEDNSKRKLPSNPESFETMAVKCLNYTAREPQIQELNRICSPSYYKSENAVERLNESITKMRGGADWSAEATDVSKHLYWHPGREEQGKIIISDYLRKEAETLPRFQYYGFSRSEIEEQKISSPLSAKVTALKKAEEAKKAKLERNIPKSWGRRRR